MKTALSLSVGVALVALATPLHAQEAATGVAADEAAVDDSGENVIIVTGVARGTNRLDTANSISVLGDDSLEKIAPRSAAELLRNIPGIRSESSGGEGNANIQVRGLPVASGGAKFLQLQEDGLPLLEFGDITFGNADIFLRTDYNVARVEAIRGGSASTFTSNSPGGIVNFISKTGKEEGGSVGVTAGVDYREYRFDADFGGKIGEDLYFHFGGFYRQGTGPRDVGYNGLKGGQFKANITKEFESGYVRVYAKYLNDRAIGYLPNPVQVTGTNSKPKYRNVPGFDINEDSLHSALFLTATSLNTANSPQQYDVREGMHPVVKSLGVEAQFEVAEKLTLTNRFRFSDVGGSFVSPFPGSVVTGATAASDVGGAGSRLVYANGALAGQAFNPASLVGEVVLFNTRLNSLDNIANDMRLNYEFGAGSGSGNATLGFYASSQDINTSWLWTSHLLEVKGGGQAALLDVINAAGTKVTQNGTVGFGASFFGNCCRRLYDVSYDTYAPFAAVDFKFGQLSVDGSIRLDYSRARGNTFGSDLGGGRVGVTSFNFDNNAAIDAAEAKTSVLPLNAPAPVNYNTDYVSYSFGANYLISNDLSVFGRYSRGGRANADRILFNNSAVNLVTGKVTDKEIAVDYVNQAELGVKYIGGGLSLFATGFYAKTDEQNFEATTRTVFDRKYRALGIELEGVYRMGPVRLSAGATYTDAEITKDNISPANKGNRPRRQAKLIYQGSAQYDADMFSVGAFFAGTTSSYTQDSNQLKLPGFTQVNAFVQFRPLDNLELSLNANNLFNVNGFTEAEEGSIPGNGIVRARSINGRTISASARFRF